MCTNRVSIRFKSFFITLLQFRTTYSMMRSPKFKQLFTMILLLFYMVDSNSAVICGWTQSLCGTQCYSPTQQRCINGIVCGWTQSLCGTHCYSPTQQKCINGIVCGWTQSLCGTQCYSPTQQRCINGIICGWDQSLCGTQCYTPSQQRCRANNVLIKS